MTQPLYAAGCRMPSDDAISRMEAEQRMLARIANERFVEALGRYFANGGRG